MAGLPGTRLAPDPPDGPRAALVIATTRYEDPELSLLRAPAHDAEELAEVLGDPGIGAFTVTSVIDVDERQIRRAIDVFLSGRGVGDLVVVYLSCHGVLDRRNRLYFAAADTLKAQLGSTGIPAAWLMDELEECRARSKVLILDCCFSGAFAHGSKGDADLDLERRLAGHGRGQAVLTASRAGEYSFEGQALPGSVAVGSVFTAGLVEGLRTGAADAGGDGYVSVDEAFDYASGYVLSSGASQTPQRWLYGGEGSIVLTRSPAGVVVTPAPLPEALAASLDSPYPAVRIGAVNALGEWLSGADPGRALTAEQRLRQIAEADVPAVAAAARAWLSSLDPVGTELGGPAVPAARPFPPPEGHVLAATPSVHGDEEPVQAPGRIARGIASSAKLIARTLGPRGRACLVRDAAGNDVEASDARTIVEHFVPEDPRDVLGASYVRDMVREQQRAVHDGGATAAVLARAMAARAMEAWHDGAGPVPLMRGMDAAVKQVSEELVKLAKEVETKEQVASIAATSAGERALGVIIAEAADKVGHHGVILVEEGSSISPQVKLKEPCFDKGYISSQFVTDQERMEAVLDNPYILIADFTLSASEDLLPLLQKVAQSGRSLAVVAWGVESEALVSLIEHKSRGALKSVAVEAPGSGEHRRAVLGDLALLTGGQVLSEEVGLKPAIADLGLLGRARKLIVTKDETTVLDSEGDDYDALADCWQQISDGFENADSDHDRKNLQDRMRLFFGGYAVITVGAETATECQQRKQHAEAAILVVRGAVESGFLPGGGAALVDVQRRVQQRPRKRDGLIHRAAPPSSDEAIGAAIVFDSLAEPLKQIVANAGHHDPAAAANTVMSMTQQGIGFDAAADTENFKDMLRAGILDTVPVASHAVTNAANLTKRLLLLG